MSTLTIIKPDLSKFEITWDDLRAIPPDQQIVDVNQLDKRFRGTGIYLTHLILRLGLDDFRGKVKLTASNDDYDITLELPMIKASAILIYALDGKTISVDRGGPFRLMIPGTRICKTEDVINNCANVKFLDGIQFLPEEQNIVST